jgi:Protein kinase domain
MATGGAGQPLFSHIDGRAGSRERVRTVFVGKHIGPYRLCEEIAVGPLGTVYRARHIDLDRQVAIKVLHARFAEDPEMVQRFENQAQSTSAVHHPNVVEVFDLGKLPDGTCYFAMELLAGASLTQLLGARFSVERALRVAQGIAGAVAAAHLAGVLHGNLKPSNIQVLAGDFVKVTDFGVTGALDVATEYWAPEMIGAGAEIDPRSDVHALGVLLYQLLIARLPFADTAARRFTLPRQIRREVPEPVEELVVRALAEDPNQRFPSAVEFLRALKELEPRRRSRPWRWLALAAAPALAAAGLVAFMCRPAAIVIAPTPATIVAPTTIPPAPTMTAAAPAMTAAAPTTTAAKAGPDTKRRPASVSIMIRTRPPGAELRVDDRRVPNPYRRQAAPSEWTHIVEARAAGRTSKSTWVRFDRDTELLLTLASSNALVRRGPSRAPEPEPRSDPVTPAPLLQEYPQ